MKVSFELTEQDYIEYNIFHHMNSKASHRSIQILRFIFPIIFLCIIFPLTKITAVPLLWWIFTGLISSSIWIIRYPKFIIRTLNKSIKKMLSEGKNVGLLGNRTIVITDSAIISEGESGEVTTHWNAVERICETEDYIFVYIASVMAYIIPARAFTSREEKSDFVSAIRKNANNTTLISQ